MSIGEIVRAQLSASSSSGGREGLVPMGVGHPRTQRAPQPLDAVGLRVIGRRIHQHEMATQLLQHVVDAYAAQTARASTKPITLAFALVGLYLHLEKNQTGKQVQRVHMLLAG